VQFVGITNSFCLLHNIAYIVFLLLFDFYCKNVMCGFGYHGLAVSCVVSSEVMIYDMI
jgi:hypothetical protein